MTRTFVYTQHFQKAWDALKLTDSKKSELENLLLSNPNKGDLISDSGGLRKIRLAFGNSGKSGSLRVLYVDFAHCGRLYFLFVYPKNVSDNITTAQKHQFKKLITSLSDELSRKDLQK